MVTPSMRQLRRWAGWLLLAIVLWWVDPRRFLTVFRSVEPLWLAALFVAAIVGRLFRALKWNWLLRACGIFISHARAIRICWEGHFFGAWTPGGLGGDAYRAVALRDDRATGKVVATLAWERYLGASALACLALVTLPWSHRELAKVSPWLSSLTLTVGLGLIGLLLIVGTFPKWSQWRRIQALAESTKLAARFQSWHSVLARIHPPTSALIQFGILSFIEVAIVFAINLLAIGALGLKVPMVPLLLALPAIHLMLRIPLTAQGLGIQEWLLIAVLLPHGVTPAQGLAVGTLLRGVEWLIIFLPGLLLFCFTERRPKKGSGLFLL